MKIQLKYIVAILAAALIIYGVVQVAVPVIRYQQQVHLGDYISVEFDGANNYATATATFKDYSFRKKYEERYGADACDAIQALCAHGSFSPASGLSNNDTVVFSWDAEQAAAIAEQYGMNLDYADTSYTVSGLSGADEFYPFYGLSVSFSGSDGSGEAALVGSPEGNGAELSFYISPSTGLYNDDTVRLYAQAPDGSNLDTYCMSHFGKLPSSDYKEYTVSGLDANLTTLSQLADGEIISLAQRAIGSYEDKVVSDYGEGQTYNGMSLAAATLLVNDANSIYTTVNNYLVLTFAVSVHNHHQYDTGERYDADNTYYWNIVYRNLNVSRDGTFTADFDTPRLYANGLTHIYATIPSQGTTIRWDNDGYNTLDDALNAAESIATHFYLADEWIY